MARMRKPKWWERNLIAKGRLPHPEQWRVISRDWETMVVCNRKTGAVREIAMGGKLKPARQPAPDPSSAQTNFGG